MYISDIFPVIIFRDVVVYICYFSWHVIIFHNIDTYTCFAFMLFNNGLGLVRDNVYVHWTIVVRDDIYIYIYIYILYIYIYIYNYYRSKIFHYGCGFVRYARSLHTYFQGHTALLGLFWHLRSPFSPHIPVALPGDALSQDPEGQLWLSCRILGGRVGERQGYDQGHAPSWC